MKQTQKLPCSAISTDGTQTRCETHEETVASYAEAMTDGAEFPPLDVFHDGAGYFLADGFHRLFAAKRCGFKDIACTIHQGTKLDALRFSLQANQSHGLRRTNADKRRCVELAIQNFGDLSSRAIADLCGVSDMFVGKVRDELQTVCSSKPEPRKGRDGKTRKIPIRKQPDTEPEQKTESEEPVTLEASNFPDTAYAPELTETPNKKIVYRPSNGMEYAEMAILQLKKIQPTDTEKDDAFDHVIAWINKNR